MTPSSHLDLWPVFVKKKESTQGHAFVVMLALLIQRELEQCWSELNTTVKEGIDELGAIHMQEVHLGGACIQDIPTPNKLGKQLLQKARVQRPSVLPRRNPNVHTTKKLPSERKRT